MSLAGCTRTSGANFLPAVNITPRAVTRRPLQFHFLHLVISMSLDESSTHCRVLNFAYCPDLSQQNEGRLSKRDLHPIGTVCDLFWPSVTVM